MSKNSWHVQNDVKLQDFWCLLQPVQLTSLLFHEGVLLSNLCQVQHEKNMIGRRLSIQLVQLQRSSLFFFACNFHSQLGLYNWHPKDCTQELTSVQGQASISNLALTDLCTSEALQFLISPRSAASRSWQASSGMCVINRHRFTSNSRIQSLRLVQSFSSSSSRCFSSAVLACSETQPPWSVALLELFSTANFDQPPLVALVHVWTYQEDPGMMLQSQHPQQRR